jgi:hypothetical protein
VLAELQSTVAYFIECKPRRYAVAHFFAGRREVMRALTGFEPLKRCNRNQIIFDELNQGVNNDARARF